MEMWTLHYSRGFTLTAAARLVRQQLGMPDQSESSTIRRLCRKFQAKKSEIRDAVSKDAARPNLPKGSEPRYVALRNTVSVVRDAQRLLAQVPEHTFKQIAEVRNLSSWEVRQLQQTVTDLKWLRKHRMI